MRIETRDDGTLDEVVVDHPVSVHLEQMEDDSWWLGIDIGDGDPLVVWLGTRGRKAKGGRPKQKPQRIFGTTS